MNVKTYFLIALILAFSLIPIVEYSDHFLTPTPVGEMQAQYSVSQYVLGDAAIERIADGVVYVVAAESYASGEDPTKINFEHPPLVKYLFGLSYHLTGSMLWVNIVASLLVFSGFYVLMRRFVSSYWLQLFGLILFGTLKLTRVLPSQYLLDWISLAWLIWYVLFTWILPITRRNLLLGGLLLGAFFSSKYWFPVGILILGITVIRLLTQRQVRSLLLHILVGVVIYLLSYSAYFFHGHSLLDFVRFELWRFDWWTGERTMPKFELLRMILNGSFYYGDSDLEIAWADHWSLMWPVLFLGWIVGLIKAFSDRKLILIHIYCVSLLLAYLIGGASAERYMIYFFPFWIVTFCTALIQSSPDTA